MAVSEDGEVVGSLSGGCVESSVVDAALRVLASGRPRICTFGYSDDDAFAVGLTCGGTLRVFVEPLDGPGSLGDLLDELAATLHRQQPAATATVVGARLGRGGATVLVRPGHPPTGSLGDERLDRAVVRDVLARLDAGAGGLQVYGSRGQALGDEVTVFIDAFAPPPRMVLFGAVEFSAALAAAARLLGYRVTVCDPRAAFATPRRFPMADEVVVDWPDRFLDRLTPALGPRDAVCILTHDARVDVPAITAALRTPVGYIGAMGSRRTTADRRERLCRAGVAGGDLGRLMAPIGLDIGARTPEETAVSICAEIIGRRAGRALDGSLYSGTGPIHGALAWPLPDSPAGAGGHGAGASVPVADLGAPAVRCPAVVAVAERVDQVAADPAGG
jgi:xanthine dehydrogenase accessory factor